MSGTFVGFTITAARGRGSPATSARPGSGNRTTWTPANASAVAAIAPPRKPPANRSLNQCARSSQRLYRMNHQARTITTAAAVRTPRRRRVSTIAASTITPSTVAAVKCPDG